MSFLFTGGKSVDQLDTFLDTAEHAAINHAGLPGVGVNVFGGDGTEGSVTFAVSGPISGIHNYINLTINPGVILTVPSFRAVHIKCTGNLVNNGTLTAVGSGFAGGAAVLSGTGLAGTAGNTAGGGGGGANNAAIGGGAGGAGNPVLLPSNPGGAGGAAGGGGPGGAPAATNAFLTDVGIFSVALRPGGGGGSGAGTGVFGGAGGAGGSVILIEVRGDITDGTISASGANGTNAPGNNPSCPSGGPGGGGGGGGGALMILYGGTRTIGSATASGGSGGVGALGASAFCVPGFLGGTGGTGAAGILIIQKVTG